MRRSASGFTLIELLCALSLLALLLAIALPTVSAARAKTHSTNARAAMSLTLHDSFRYALAASSEVVVCPSRDSAGCAGGSDWTAGWIAFSDEDGDRQRGALEPLIRSEQALPRGVRLRSTTGRSRLLFQPNGSNAGSNVSFTLCDDRGPRYAISLVLANNGRLRTGVPTIDAATRCVYG